MKSNRFTLFGKHILINLLLLTLMASILSCAFASVIDDSLYDGEIYEFDFENNEYDFEVILDDPFYFMFDDEDLYDSYYEEETVAAPSPLPTEPAPPRLSTPKPIKKDPLLYDIPKEILEADEKFAMIIEEATKYIGYPYVWGGHCPETSFDCSGFVSYVYTFSGVYKTGGRGATGLHSLCAEVLPVEARPGDLVFFTDTMGKEVSGITHVGIYVGNNMMLHCGNPIGYADLTEPFWQEHFYVYGRLPY